jgi:ATP-binding cassette, subfamily B, bacterial
MNKKQKIKNERIKRFSSDKIKVDQIKYVPRALKLIWEAASGWSLSSSILLIFQGVLPAISIFLTREMVNSLVLVIDNSGNQELLFAALPIVGMLGVTIFLREIIGDAQAYVNAQLANRTQDYMFNLIYEKTTSLDMQFYESPLYYDQLQRASTDAVGRPLNLLKNINGLLQGTITLITILGVLFTFSWWIPPLLALGTIPSLKVSIKTSRIRQKWRLKNTVEQRRLGYFKQTLTTAHAAPELRIFGLGKHFKHSHKKLRRKLREESLNLLRESIKNKFQANIVGLIVVFSSTGWMAWSAFQGMLDLGDIVMFWQAINQSRTLIRRQYNGVDNLYTDILFLDDLFTFLDLEPILKDPESPIDVPNGLNKNILLENVSFSYPHSESNTLEKFNLEIPANKIVAIVGKNGSGKSTLLKLICRFYDPNKGKILWDGFDYKEINQKDIWKRITVLFQNPLVFDDSAADNIKFGDLDNEPSSDMIMTAATSGGASEIINKLPEKYNTMLGKRFGKSDLSIGEWQRIALSRAFIRDANLIILDEPTSAMDSWTENSWMRRFRKLVTNRTAIIITHRFTTAMQADIIHVLEEGKIKESGTHKELIKLGGLYAQSWNEQISERARITKTENSFS